MQLTRECCSWLVENLREIGPTNAGRSMYNIVNTVQVHMTTRGLLISVKSHVAHAKGADAQSQIAPELPGAHLVFRRRVDQTLSKSSPQLWSRGQLATRFQGAVSVSKSSTCRLRSQERQCPYHVKNILTQPSTNLYCVVCTYTYASPRHLTPAAQAHRAGVHAPSSTLDAFILLC